MAKAVVFELKVLGTDEQIKSQNNLAEAIKRVNAELKNAELGSESYRALEKELGNLKLAQKDIADSARLVQRELEAEGGATAKTYRSMNAELVKLRNLYKDLTEAERDGDLGANMRERIAGLDKELKDIDASIGNFQRNVGNYEGAIKTAFAPIQQMLQTSVPGFQQLEGAATLFRSGIDQIGAAATSTGKLLTGAFIGIQVITLLLEGAKAIKEFTDETTKLRGEIGRMSKESPAAVKSATSGIMAIAQTFGKEQNEILNAANAVSKNYRISFEQSLKLIEQGLLAGADANGKFLDSLTEMTPKAKGAGASVDQLFVALTQAGRAGLEEEEALEAIIRRGNEFTGTVGEMVDASDTLTAKQIEQMEAERELAAAKVQLSQEIKDLTGVSGNLWTQLETFGLKAVGLVTKSIQGLVWMVQDLGTALGITEERAQSTAEVIGDRSAYESGEQANKALQIAQQLTAKELADQQKQRADAAKKLREEREKLQREANEAEARYMEQRIGLLNTLNGRLADLTIQGIQDLTAREIAEENARFEALKAKRAADARQQEAEQLEARAKLVEAYGKNSQKVADFDRQAIADIQARRDLAAQVEQKQLTAHLQKLEDIRTEATLKAAENEARRVTAGLDAIRQAYAIAAAAEAIEVEKAVNAVLKSTLPQGKKDELILKIRIQADKAAIQQSSAEIDEEVQRIQARLDAIANDATATTGSIAEYEQLTAQLDALLLKREKNEQAYTEIVNKETARRRAQWGKEIEVALQNASQVVGAFDQFANALYERDIARIEEREAANSESITRIEEKLKTATGFQKQQLEQQLAQEKAKEQAIANERARLEKEEGKRAKAFAVIQSIINTALAVTKAFATVPPPANVAAAIFAGAAGAAQTATILAQPAAKGALIGSVAAIDTGLIVAPQNIPTLPNGDNVLATVKRGEVVLNKAQQIALGGAPTFRAIGVPGFAGGGVIGEALGAPDLSGITNAERVKLLEDNLKAVTTLAVQVNQRVDRIRTYVVSSDVSDDLVEGAAIRAMATL